MLHCRLSLWHWGLARNVPWMTNYIKEAQTKRRRLKRNGGALASQCITKCSWTSGTLSEVCAPELKRTTIRKDTGLWIWSEEPVPTNGWTAQVGKPNSSAHPWFQYDLANKFCDFFVSKTEATWSHLNSLGQKDKPSGHPAHTPPIHSQICTCVKRDSDQGYPEIADQVLRVGPHTKAALKIMDSLVPFITTVMNWLLTTDTFPAGFKTALVRPLVTTSSLGPRHTESLEDPCPIWLFWGSAL